MILSVPRFPISFLFQNEFQELTHLFFFFLWRIKVSLKESPVDWVAYYIFEFDIMVRFISIRGRIVCTSK